MYLADSTLNAVVERGAQAQSPCSRTRSHSDVSICHRYPIYPYTDSTHNVQDWNWSWLPLSFLLSGTYRNLELSASYATTNTITDPGRGHLALILMLHIVYFLPAPV